MRKYWEEPICGIYRISRRDSDKSYIGQSRDIFKRWKEHSNLSRKKLSCISSALKLHGLGSFVWEVIEECSLEELNDREVYWISYFDSMSPNGYNLTSGGGQGKIISEESRAKMSEAAKASMTEERRAKISEAIKGKTHSEETKKKISESINAAMTDEVRAKMSEAQKASMTDERRAKISKATKAAMTDEVRARISEASKAAMTDERRARNSEANKGRIFSEESRAKMSEACKRKPKVTCPYCGKEGSISVMGRWHFDNCKLKPQSPLESETSATSVEQSHNSDQQKSNT